MKWRDPNTANLSIFFFKNNHLFDTDTEKE